MILCSIVCECTIECEIQSCFSSRQECLGRGGDSNESRETLASLAGTRGILMRFRFTHERSACAPTATRRRTRTSSPRSFKAPSHILPLVLARNHLHRNRAVPSLCVHAYVRARVQAGSFIHVAVFARTRARARERVHAHTRDGGGDSRGQARRRRRLARSSPTTATMTVNEIVGSVSANYRAVPGVRGASLIVRSYLPPCVVARKGVASGREKSAITPT